MNIPQFYPIVPDATHAKLYIDTGVRFLQIRLKELPYEEIVLQLQDTLTYAKAHNATLIINDYWQEAIALKADYIHLGQEDLDKADINAIRRANVKFGLSTHDTTELNRALEYSPDYVALGPIYFTQLKAMTWAPQGLEKIADWKKKIGDIPLIAIGGITLEHATDILDIGADSVSVVTDITRHKTPQQRLKSWLQAYPHKL
ncbi:MAG: thiamine phosphate synthase [Pseudomonadota bacterium]